MANRVKDILIDVGSGDPIFSSKYNKSFSFDEVIWGALFPDDDDTLYANIYIPLYNISSLVADDDKFKIFFHSYYQPNDMPFKIRIVTKENGEYVKINQDSCDFPVETLAFFPHDNSTRIHASELQFINSEGYYVALLVFGEETNSAFVYSAGNVDFDIDVSDEQSAQLLSLCAPGKYYRYPISGVDITKYINTVVGYTDLSKRIVDEFSKDSIDVQGIDFNSSNGDIDIQFKRLEIQEDDAIPVDERDNDVSLIDITDEMLSDISSQIDLDGYGIDYEELQFDIDVPDAALESCFANGIWIGSYPWTGAELWKGHE